MTLFNMYRQRKPFFFFFIAGQKKEELIKFLFATI
jgi:hypothetical protein